MASSVPRSSSGRIIKKNTKYGEIQGQAFERVVQKMVGPDPLSDEEYDSEAALAGGTASESEDGTKANGLGPDLDPDDVCRCVVCWDPCSPAPAAAKAYNRLNGYVAEHGDKPAQLITGALGMDLDAAAKFELLCPVCAALVRELEEREQQVQLLRGQLLERFTRSQQLLQPPAAAEEKEPADGETEGQEDEVQAALKALRADAQHGMLGIPGLGLPLPEPPPAVRYIISGEGDVLPREEDTVEAYLSRRDEWITQTPGAAGSGLVHAVVEASADGIVPPRAGPGVQPYPCSECERVFSSPEALARHEYFQHEVGELPGAPGGSTQRPAAVAVEVVMEEAGAALGQETTLEDEENEDSGTSSGAGRGAGQMPGKRRRGRPRLPDSVALRSGPCQYCGKFIKVDLQGHINRFHTMVRPHHCDICGKRLVSRHALAEHRQVMHGAGQPCDHCGATFARKKQLSMHLWRKHGIGGVQCRVCGKKFARSDTLDGHMRCHERPMQCSLCPARYPFKRELRNHEFLKHGLHGEIPRDSDHRPGEMYRCGNCGRCFGSWAGRDRHTCDSAAPLSDLYVCQLCGDWSTRFEGDMVKHMRNLHKIEAETILIADIEDDGAAAGGQEDAAVAEEEENEEEEDEPPARPNILTSASRAKVKDDQ
ncbi:zinc finger protein 853-like [Amphibalanus amphitrite]|uniref:zinc finger protein 853-like n=1 Tax=Amphibalanus amphitrite TaxID=1232801 RepID=UPI001C905CDC|nr:zinc finger protein 853-like [Amphibalanus amphitrite]XP_043195253.1 zinc finger protein 853-like [Amphibalanus amphitrite]XP_043195254.1 zinc finger protein 853-like [Amphibalanus amphitrite]XP_043195255.1 zinc finger protein 853-like [Amphibalanus amphitrite]XP_043195256.1 zinc finger protein 853-like [Amphibalanus amphitrite]XP_043195257.1 zinc finger protein 853-like [Amphibalanus amphitrite]XP_043195258.1 zinc finger protein 853-like [Amphibalanus amphitrite]XP_043195259.1 zinc finge